MPRRLGAEVTLIERDVVGGAAHLWDCIPSKTMIATGGAMSFSRRIHGMGLEQQDAEVDIEALTEPHRGDQGPPAAGHHPAAGEPGRAAAARHRRGWSATTTSRSTTAEGTRTISADAVLVATGSRPRIPDWCVTDGERILTTRDCYPPSIFPESITVIGSGVTGVEFVHMFSQLRRQGHPGGQPPAGAAAEGPRGRRRARRRLPASAASTC